MDIDAPTNHPGALIFWAYIVAALASTGVVLNTIRKSYLQNNGRPKIPPLLAILALSSFATLSYHAQCPNPLISTMDNSPQHPSRSLDRIK
jgi:hypothetical protein